MVPARNGFAVGDKRAAYYRQSESAIGLGARPGAEQLGLS